MTDLNEVRQDGGGLGLPAMPPLASPRVRLREVQPVDYPYIYHLAASPETAFRFRFRGAVPSYEEYLASQRNAGILLQCLITSTRDGRPLGVVICYKADFRNEHAFIAIQGDPSLEGQGWIIEGIRMFIDYIFWSQSFIKLYAEVYEFSLPAFRSILDDAFKTEGCLKQHEKFAGERWDFYTLALYREDWYKRKLRLDAEREARGIITKNVEFDDFMKTVVSVLGIEAEGPLSPETRLRDDLGLDSVQLLEMIDVLESLNCRLDDQVLGSIHTLGDLHFEYIQNRTL